MKLGVSQPKKVALPPTATSAQPPAQEDAAPGPSVEHVAMDDNVPLPSAYSVRQRELRQAWDDQTAALVCASVQEEAYKSPVCNVVHCASEGVIRCNDCSRMSHYCETCFVEHHQRGKLHVAEIWKVL